ncbi:MAG TPA: ATP-binding cassette domain-containing protein [Anaerolineales bacterium]
MSILLDHISKRYGGQAVVNDVSLEVGNGEFFVLLGSSGSGKTTVLNMIAGLVPPDQGRVLLHDRDVTDLPVQQRRVGFVFQNYALFEYMSVAENIEFGLRVRKLPGKKRRTRRDELLELVGLAGLGSRMPSQLSGGQQQRVALARALALEPDVLLLDEPLGALDAKIRLELRRSLKAIQHELGVAAILVTHDQEEAFDLGDRIGVMSYGRLVEVGTPRDLYQHPQTEFVASFLGTANILVAAMEAGRVRVGPQSYELTADAGKFSTDGRVQVVFRPEDLALAEKQEDLSCPPLGQATVTSLGFNGPAERIRLELPSIPGVRAIAPTAAFGSANIVIDASRPPDQSSLYPLAAQDKAWVGLRRLHCLSHPGMSFMVITDGTMRSQSAIDTGGYLARMSHARVLLLGIGRDRAFMETHLQEARKQLGSGMASVEARMEHGSVSEAVERSTQSVPVDMVILGWRPMEGAERAEQVLRSGSHHLLLAARPGAHIEKALVCTASGEPGKDDVMFAGRLLRHLGARAKLLSIADGASNGDQHTDSRRHFMENGVRTLEMFGVPTESELRPGDPAGEILGEIKREEFPLVVLGAPLSLRHGYPALRGVIETIMKNAGDCSILIVRSNYLNTRVRQRSAALF